MTLFTAGYAGTIVPYAFDPEQGHLHQLNPGIAPNSSGTSPSWIAFASRRPHSASSAEQDAVTRFYSVDESSPGRVFSHTYDRTTALITSSGSASSGGAGPVSCILGHGPSARLLFVANYDAGSAAVLRVNDEGGELEGPLQVVQFTRQGEPVGPVRERQDHSYAHQVSLSPCGRWVYVCDLGADQIHRLRVRDGRVEHEGSTDVKPGSGPRHVAFYEDPEGRTWAYLASELDNTVSAFRVDPRSGELQLVGDPLLASPPGIPLSGEGVKDTGRTTAEIAITPCGTHVYVSNRGDTREDHISVFRRDAQTGELRFQEWVQSGGRMPRHFSLSVDGEARWLVVGHQEDENLVVFRRDTETGALSRVGGVQGVGPVAYAGFAPF